MEESKVLQEGVYMELAAEDGEHRPRLGKNWIRCSFLPPVQKRLEGTARWPDGGRGWCAPAGSFLGKQGVCQQPSGSAHT